MRARDPSVPPAGADTLAADACAAMGEDAFPPDEIGAGQSSGLRQIVWLVIVRDLRLAMRHWDQVIQPLIFFVIITTLFPLAISPALEELRRISPGVLWVAAMLSSLLALESLFRPDVEDGTMEQWVLSGQPLSLLLLAKTATHWL